jgi:hypothetical protein
MGAGIESSINVRAHNKIKGARPVRRSRHDLQPVPHVDFSHGGPEGSNTSPSTGESANLRSSTADAG